MIKSNEQIKKEFSRFVKPMFGKQITAAGEIEVRNFFLTQRAEDMDEVKRYIKELNKGIPKQCPVIDPEAIFRTITNQNKK